MAREFYRRNLPHWQPPGAILFTTFRLHGSLPKEVELSIERESRCIRELAANTVPMQEERVRLNKRLFVAMDKALDQTCTDNSMLPRFLAEEKPARAVVSCIRAGCRLRRFLLHRYSVMPNHVHLLMEPLRVHLEQDTLPEPSWPPLQWRQASWASLSAEAGSGSKQQTEYWPIASILKGMKGASSREIGRVVTLHPPIWQKESFDHWVRDADEYTSIISYIDSNPVKAGLCTAPADWPWSSAGEIK